MAKKKSTASAPEKKGKFEFIDRSNGKLLRKSDLDPKKPHISPISGQATVERLPDEE